MINQSHPEVSQTKPYPGKQMNQAVMGTKTPILAPLVLIIALSAIPSARSQVSYDGTALNYLQNFDSLGTSTVTWTDNSTILGWYLNSTTLGVPASVAASTGNNSSGAAFNMGVAGVNSVNDRALGWLTTSATGTGYVGVQLQNSSGLDYLGDVTVTLTLEQWSARNVTVQSVLLQDKLNIATPGNQLTSTSWTTLDTLNGPNLSNAGGVTTHYIDGNDPANRVTVTDTVTFTSGAPWVAGRFLWFKTLDAVQSGNNDMFGIDDVSITVAAIPEPATWALAALGGVLSLAGLQQRRR